MSVFALLTEKQTFFDANSNELTGGLLFVYLAGTTTKATSYTETDGVTPNSNPIVLNSRGEVPSGLYVAGGATYKLVLAPATDTDPPTSPIWTRDNLTPTNDIAAASGASQWVTSTYTVSYSNATTFTVNGDVTAVYQVNRRVRATIGSGNLYGTIETSSHSLGVTTVTVLWDSGSMDASLAAVDYALLSGADPSVPVPVTQRVRNQLLVGGNATIGTTSLIGQRVLDVTNTNADATASATAYVQSNAGQLQAVIGSTAGGGTASLLSTSTGVMNVYTTGAAALQLGTNNTPTRLVIDSSGNVNVPTTKLRQNSTNVFCRDNMAESGELGIANNTLYTFAHSLGAIPKLLQAVLRCKTAEFGYAINDEVPLHNFVNSGSNVSTSVWADATNIYARINSSAGNNYSLARVSSNDAIAITYANWRIVVRGWY